MVKRPIIFTVVAFTLAGPPVGAALITAWGYLDAIREGQTSGYPAFYFQEPFIFVAIYAFGTIPAATAGFIWAVAARQIVLTRPLSRFIRLPVAAIVGAFSAFLSHTSDALLLCVASTSLLALVFPLNRWLAVGSLTIAGTDARVPSVDEKGSKQF
jgi:hypothetical protein